MKEELIRAEFEKWYTQNDTPQTAARALERNNIGSYKLMHAHQSWLVWLAASTPLLERIAVQTVALNAAKDALLDANRNGFTRGIFALIAINTALQHKEQTNGNR